MKKYCFSVLTCLILLNSGCMGNADQLIHGSKYNYMIPGNHIKKSDRSLFSKSFKTDGSKSLHLVLTNKISKHFNTLGDSRVSIIIFLDREYDYVSGLKAESKSILGESERVPCSGWPACYERNFTGDITNYYFTFDPEKIDLERLTSENYIYTVYPAQSLSIGNITTIGKDACSYDSVVDGMLLHVSSSGNICTKDGISILTKGVLSLFHDWRIYNNK